MLLMIYFFFFFVLNGVNSFNFSTEVTSSFLFSLQYFLGMNEVVGAFLGN